MAKRYQYLVEDDGKVINKKVGKISRKTGLNKSRVLQIMLTYSIEKASDIFPDLKENDK